MHSDYAHEIYRKQYIELRITIIQCVTVRLLLDGKGSFN